MKNLSAALALVLISACSGELPLDKVPCHDDGECPTDAFCTPSGTCAQAPICAAPSVRVHGTCVVAPGPVTAVTATGGAKQIALQWPAVTGADGYVVKRAAGGGLPAAEKPVSGTAFTDVELPNGTKFTYSVVAQNGAGRGIDSPAATAITTMPAPASASATRGLGASQTTGIELTWSAVANATGYAIRRSVDGAAFAPLTSTTGPGTGHTDSGLVPGTRYAYEIAALGSDAQSQGALAEAVTGLDLPSNVTVGNATTSSLDLSWHAVTGAEGYKILRSDDRGTTFFELAELGATTTFTDILLTPGFLYTYKLIALTHAAQSDPSGPVFLATLLDDVTGLVVENGLTGTSVPLVWDEVSGATSYTVSRRGPAFTDIGTTSTPRFTDTTVTPGLTFEYGVVAHTADAASATMTRVTVSTPLDAPASLTATPTTTTVALTWAAVTGAAVYDVDRSTDGTNFTTVKSGNGSTFYTDTALTPGVSYSYRVRARSAGISSPNAAVTSVTLLDAPAFTSIGNPTNTTVTLSWANVTGANLYDVERSSDGGATYSGVIGTQGLTYTDVGLTPGKKYFWRVRARSAAQTSQPSAPGSGITTIAAPTSFAATGSTATSLTLTWDAVPGATGYDLTRTLGANTIHVGATPTISGGSTATYTDTGLTSGTTYTYRLTAIGSDASSAASTANGTTSLGQVTNLSVTVTGTTASLTWTAVAGATSYGIERTGPGSTIFNVNSATASYTDAGLTTGVSYSYRVKAQSSTSAGPFSTAFAAVVPLATPTNLTMGSLKPDLIQISWTASPNATGYVVDRDVNGDGSVESSFNTTDVSFTDTSVISNTKYAYRVKATNALPAATSAATAFVSGTTGLQAPKTLQLSGGPNQLTLTWSAVAGNISGYLVFRSTDGTNFVQLTPSATPITGTSFTDTGLTMLATYYYYVVSTSQSAAPPTSGASPTAALTVPPSPPTNVSLGILGPNEMQLTWTAPAVTGSLSYVIQRSTDQVNWGTLGSFLPTVGNTTSYTDESCTQGVTYYYRMATWTAYAGQSAFTNPIGAKYTLTPPAAPGGLTATAVGTNLTLSWSAAGGATAYTLERSDDSGATWYALSVGGSATSFTDVPNPGILEAYRVQATSPAHSAYSNIAYGAVGTPAAPTNLTATFGGGLVQLTCSTVPGVDTYTFLRSNDGRTWTNIANVGSSCAFNDSGAPAGQVVYYSVEAGYISTGVFSSMAQAVRITTPLGTPAAPTIGATAADGVSLSWAAIPGATGYIVERSSNGGSSFTNVGAGTVPTTTATSYDDRDTFAAAVSYVWRITAWTPATTGKGAAVSASRTLSALYTPPTNLVASPSQSQISLSWSPGGGSGGLGYFVYRSTDGNIWTLLNSNGASPTTLATSYVDTAVAAGTQYWYRVATSQSTGSGRSYTTAAVTATTPPAVPSLTAVPGATQVVLTWASFPGVAMYEVGRSTSPTGPYPTLATVQGATSYVDTAVTAGTSYSYVLRSIGNTGLPSGNSAVATVTPGSAHVSGVRRVTYIGDTAAQNVVGVPDLSTSTISGYDPVSGVQYPGAFGPDGSFAIANVPNGPYWVVLTINSTSVAILTSARSVDLSYPQTGSGAPVLSNLNPTLVVASSTSSLAPAGVNDTFELFGWRSGYANFFVAPQIPLLPGQTTMSQLVSDFTSSPLLQNEPLILTQESVKTTSNGMPYTAVVRSAQTAPMTLADGTVVNTGPLAFTAPASSSLSVNYRRSIWNGLSAQIHPTASPVSEGFSVQTGPQVATLGQTGATADLVAYQPTDHATTDVVLTSMTYANPFNSAWGSYGVGFVQYFGRYGLPGRTGSRTGNSIIWYQEPLATFTTDAQAGFAPKLLPPMNPQINGLPVGTADVFGVGASPTLTWSPAPGVNPTYYRVLVTRLLPGAGQTVTSSLVGTFVVPTASLTLPPGILQQGTYYFARIEADLEPGRTLSVMPVSPNGAVGGSTTMHRAGVLTAKFTP